MTQAYRIGHNSGDPPAEVRDPGPDPDWRPDPAVHRWGEAPQSEVERFTAAVRSQGTAGVRLRALDQARSRVNFSSGITGRKFKLYSAIVDLSKRGTKTGDPRCTLKSLAEIGAMAEIDDPNEAAKLVRSLEEEDRLVAVVRFFRDGERRGYVAVVCEPEDRAGTTFTRVGESARSKAVLALQLVRAGNVERQRRRRLGSVAQGVEEPFAAGAVTEQSGVTAVTGNLPVTADVTEKSAVTSRGKVPLCHAEKPLIDSTMRDQQLASAQGQALQLPSPSPTEHMVQTLPKTTTPPCDPPGTVDQIADHKPEGAGLLSGHQGEIVERLAKLQGGIILNREPLRLAAEAAAKAASVGRLLLAIDGMEQDAAKGKPIGNIDARKLITRCGWYSEADVERAATKGADVTRGTSVKRIANLATKGNWDV